MAASQDWYVTYNVIFNWIAAQYGEQGYRRYIETMLERCYAGLLQQVEREGIGAVVRYHRDVFSHDGTLFCYSQDDGRVAFDISDCVEHRVMDGDQSACAAFRCHYCDHHRYFNEYLAARCGWRFSLAAKNDRGACRWVFSQGGEAGHAG